MKILLSIALFLSTQVNAAEVISLRSLPDLQRSTRQLSNMVSKSEGLALRSIKANASEGLTKYQEVYKGVPVWGHTVVVKIGRSADLNRLHGYFVKGIEKDITSTQPQITEDVAVMTARNHHENTRGFKNEWVYRDLKSGLYIFIDDNQKAHLAYMVTFFADTVAAGMPTRPFIFVDANTGVVLRYSNQLTTDLVAATGPGGNKKTGQYYYGRDRAAMIVDANPATNTCTMDNGEVMTVDLNHLGDMTNPEAPVDDTKAFSFTCSDNSYKAINDAFSPLNDAHANGTAVLHMYKEWFGFSPLNVKLKMRVHFGKDFENAFWDGKSMTFGDGAQNLYPTSSALDVTGHEVSHGFTEFNANLEYRAESGGINEAFSDMAGEAAEFYSRGKNDFLVGSEIMKTGDALRYMQDPKKDKFSLDNITQFKWGGSCDTLMGMANSPIGQLLYIMMCSDMHFSSGLYNKAFYLMATAPGSDTRKAFEVFVRANKNYWTEKTTFADGAKGVKDAAQDLGFPVQVVIDAFAAVGITI